MSEGRKSKSIEFVIDANQFIIDIMGENGTVSGRGTVSLFWDDSWVHDEFSDDIVLEWMSEFGESKILVGAEEDDVWDELLRHFSKSELMELPEGEEVDLSECETKSISEILGNSIPYDEMEQRKIIAKVFSDSNDIYCQFMPQAYVTIFIDQLFENYDVKITPKRGK